MFKFMLQARYTPYLALVILPYQCVHLCEVTLTDVYIPPEIIELWYQDSNFYYGS